MKSLVLPHSPSHWILKFLAHSCSTYSSLKPGACKNLAFSLLWPNRDNTKKTPCPFMALPQSSLLMMAVELPANFVRDSSSCHY